MIVNGSQDNKSFATKAISNLTSSNIVRKPPTMKQRFDLFSNYLRLTMNLILCHGHKHLKKLEVRLNPGHQFNKLC